MAWTSSFSFFKKCRRCGERCFRHVFLPTYSKSDPGAILCFLCAYQVDQIKATLRAEDVVVCPTLLHVAAFKGNAEAVSDLLLAGEAKEAKNRYGDTPLHHAVKSGTIAVVSALLAAGANKEAKNEDGQTPLHLAASLGFEPIVNVLISGGADKEATDKKGRTPLHLAADRGHSSVVMALLAAGADKEKKAYGVDLNNGHTPLHMAAAHSHVNVVSVLIAAGSNVEAITDRKWTPLHSATLYGSPEVVSVLLAAGANKEAKMERGETPLHFSSNCLDSKNLALLLAAGANKEAKTLEGNTPLHMAICHKTPNCVYTLLKAGADKEARNLAGLTPLLLASKISDSLLNREAREPERLSDIVAALLAFGANKEAMDVEGCTPFHLAAKAENTTTVVTLLAAGADIEARDKNGCTPLHLAAIGSCGEMTLLCEKHKETLRGYELPDSSAVVPILLTAGANPSAEDFRGRTPFEHAQENKKIETAKLIEKYVQKGGALNSKKNQCQERECRNPKTTGNGSRQESPDPKIKELSASVAAAFQQKRYADAAMICRQLLQIDPKSATDWSNLGAAYYLFVQANLIPYVGGNWKINLFLFDETGSITPRHRASAESLVQPAHLDGLKRCLAEARRCFEHAITLKQGPSAGCFWLARLYRAIGKWDKAKELYNVMAGPDATPTDRANAGKDLAQLNELTWAEVNSEYGHGEVAATDVSQIYGEELRKLLAQTAITCGHCGREVFKISGLQALAEDCGMSVNSDGTVFANLSQRQEADELEGRKGFCCSTCSNVYCGDCILKHAPGHVNGGKACFACGGSYRLL